jgi:HEAT repeat protein
MDDNEWPTIPGSIGGVSKTLECGFGIEFCIGDLRMYLAQLDGALRMRQSPRQSIEVLEEHALATGALQLIREALKADEPVIREAACEALYHLGDPSTAPEIRPLLHDPDDMVFVRAAEALWRFGEPSTALVPRLTEILSKSEGEFGDAADRIGDGLCQYLQMPETHYHAARILGYLRADTAPARKALRKALESTSGMVRTEAAKALAYLGEEAEFYLAPLRQAMHDSKLQSSRERVWAAEGLIDLGEPPESVVPALIELVRDKDYSTSIDAIELLGKLGCPAAADAYYILQEAKAVGEAAARALQRWESRQV